jgi:hypothetical protein
VEPVVPPDQGSLVALCWWLEHKAQSRIVAFILQAGKAVSPALEADAARLSQADTVEGVVGPTRERLGQHGVQVVSNPTDAQPFGRLVQTIFGEAVLFA